MSKDLQRYNFFRKPSAQQEKFFFLLCRDEKKSPRLFFESGIMICGFLIFQSTKFAIFAKSIDAKKMTRDCVATVGMFDGVHKGHRHILKLLRAEAERRGLEPCVVTFDTHPRIVLSKTGDDFRLLTTTEERISLLRHYGIEHVEVLHFDQQTAALSACEFLRQQLATKLHAQALVMGYDNAFGNKQRNDFSQLETVAQELGIALIHDEALYDEETPISSTQIRKALSEGNMQKANQMLGYTFNLEGTVVKGKQMGRKLGFPTANIAINDPWKAIPAKGVYAIAASDRQGNTWNGMANLGPQPTFKGLSDVLEVNLFGMKEDIYGQILNIQFIDKIRDIQRFDSLEELTAQLALDEAHCKVLFYKAITY